MLPARLLLAIVGWATIASCIEVPGIIDPSAVSGSATGIESANPISCSLILLPFNFKTPLLRSKALIPTANPPVTNYTASLTFVVRNLGTQPVDAPWTLTLNNSAYLYVSSVSDLRALSFL